MLSFIFKSVSCFFTIKCIIKIYKRSKKSLRKREKINHEFQQDEDTSDDKIKAIIEAGFINNPKLDILNPYIKQNQDIKSERYDSPK